MTRAPKIWLLLLVSLLSLYGAYRVGLRLCLNRELAAIRAQGQPTCFEDLEARYPNPPAHENPQLLWAARSPGLFPDPDLEPLLSRAPDPAALRQIQDFVTSNQNAIAWIQNFATQPHRWPYRRFIEGSYRGFLPDQLTVPLLCHAVDRTARQDSAGAAAALQAWFAIAETYTATPSAMHASDLESLPALLPWLLSRTDFTAEQLAQLQQALASFESRAAPLEWQQLLEARAERHSFLGQSSALMGEILGSRHLNRPYRVLAVHELFQYLQLRAAARRLEFSQQPLHLQWAARHTLPTAIPRWNPSDWRITQDQLEAALAGRVQPRLALVAVVARRHRLVHGRWPAQLTDLVPAWLSVMPADSFTNAPLRFQSSTDRFTAYSAGPNCIDDAAHGDDLLFSIEPAKP